MRSEKEVKEKIELKEKLRKVFGKDKDPTDYEMSIFKWMLEGEPRYSVSELEKILKYLLDSQKTSFEDYKKIFKGNVYEYPSCLLKFLKDKKRLEEILNE